MRRARRSLGAALLAWTASALLVACHEPPRHLVVVTLDTTQADRLSAYGHRLETSPALTKLAQRGVLFEDAISQAVSTPPSHASIFTGKTPPHHGLRRLWGQSLPPSQLTLAEILKQHGFTTAAFIGAVPLLPDRGLDQGFDHYDAELSEGLLERPARETNRAVREWLRSRPPGRLFLWVHYFDPHYPYNPPPPYQKLFAGKRYGPAGPVFPDDRSSISGDPAGRPAPAQADVATMRKLYDAEVRYTDDSLSDLLILLDYAGILDDAVVAVVADHGESLGEHGYYFGHWGIFRETARVPMVLAHPDGRHAGLRVTQLVRSVDLLPTLLTWLGIQPPADLDGIDLSPLLAGAAGGLTAYTEQGEYMPLRALRTEDWLLISPVTRARAVAVGRAPEPRIRLYRRRDGWEQGEDVAARYPEVRDRLVARLAELHPADEAGLTVPEPVPEDQAEQLRALGYLEEQAADGEPQR